MKFLRQWVGLLGVLVAQAILVPQWAEAQTLGVNLFGLTNAWRYNQTTSYDGSNWTARTFDDSLLPSGRGVLAQETANAFVTDKTNTVLTLGRITYYFRTHFTFNYSPAGVSLTFSNIVDDGAVYYLNGVELNRLYLPAQPTPITYTNLATSHEATTYDVFTLSGPIVETNLVNGDNVLAVEVHQTTAGSTDIVFGLALSATIIDNTPPPTLRMPPVPPLYGYSSANALGSMTFTAPVAIVSPPGETNRLFIVEQIGRIVVITNLANPTRTVFMDISARLLFNGEQGLLGLAFHPGYLTNRYFYVFYVTSGTRRDQLSRFEISPSDPNQGLTNSEVVLISQPDDFSNHNAGDLHFGADGYLYVSLGDEGGADDTGANSQRIDKDFFSAIMRLDVDKRPGSLAPTPHASIIAPTNYAIPSDNPFVGATTFNGLALTGNVRTEFWAVGLRNPWRFSFDPVTGWLYCGDVGQGAREEVDVIVKGGNYGWSYREGYIQGPRTGPPVGFNPIPPILDYPRSGSSTTNVGYSVTGGVVYRGNRFPELNGAYIFGDYGSGNIWAARYDGSVTTNVPFAQLFADPGVAAFGIDPSNGDLLYADVAEGIIKRLNSSPISGTPIPPTLFFTGAFTNLNTLTSPLTPLTPNAGVVPYDVNVPFWSDNARKTRWFFMPTNGATIGFNANGNWSFPGGMAWIKHFDLEMTNGVPSSAKRLETRILVKTTNNVYGVTYRWGNSLTNATLVPDAGLDEAFTISDGGTTRTQIWHYPSRTECVICHTPIGGYAVGFNTEQLNRDFDFGGGATNQIAALSRAGYFSSSVNNIHSLRALASPTDESASLEWRVRSYLSANCAQCHQPGGSGLGNWNANITNLTVNAGLIHGTLINNGGSTNNRVVVPGVISNSMLLTRIATRGPGQMPPLDSTLPDASAINLLSAWITNTVSGIQTFAQWQVSNFGSTNAVNAGPNFDADGDGSPNYSEYISRTDPLNSNDVWGVSILSTNGQARLEFVQPPNRAVEIQRTTSLTAPTVWQVLDVPENRPTYPAAPTAVTFSEAATNAPQKFYRVKLSAP